MKRHPIRRAFTILYAAALVASVEVCLQAQAPIVESLSRNGRLLATNMVPGTVATVEWAPTADGPWTNNWAGLDAVTVDALGKVRVSVPMFYRVRGIPLVPADMAYIPAGSFAMGDTFFDGYADELPVHSVQLSGFHIGRTEVTKAQWDEVYNWAVTNGYSFDYGALGKGPTHPAQYMTWFDAAKWCNARSQKEGRTPAYYLDPGFTNLYRTGQVSLRNEWVKWAGGYRLPTEAEWEKAARGGNSGKRFCVGDSITHSGANYNSSASYSYDVSPTRGYHPSYNDGVVPYTSPVGAFGANGYGLYDIVGNVWEWCWDWRSATYYSVSPAVDPMGPASGSLRVVRGGSYDSNGFIVRSALRGAVGVGDRNLTVGFRVVLRLVPP